MLDNADWGEFLKETCGAPKLRQRISPEVKEFTVFARSKGYGYKQIANAVKKKFGVAISHGCLQVAVYRVNESKVKV